MRRIMAVAVVAALVGGGCGPAPAFVAHGRQGSWHRVESPAFTAGPTSTIAGLVAPGDGWPAWAAVGSVRDGGRTTAVAWTSVDGARWGRSDLHQGVGRESEAAAGAHRQGVAVVVGTQITERGDRDGRIWTSRDGATWTPASAPAGGPGDQTVTSVAGGPLGFVAAGRDGPVPAVWWSADGAAWTRVDGPFLATQRIESVAVGPAGAVAVGTITTSGDVDGMVWFSPDGVAWRTVSLGGPAGFTDRAGQAVRSVTAATGRFVAVGDDANGERRVAVAWTSSDGISWQRQPPSPDMAEVAGSESTQGVSARSVSGAGPVVAVGGGYALQIWRSPDGRRWTREDGPIGGAGSGDARVAADGASILVRTLGQLWLRGAGGAWANVGGDEAVFPRSTRTSRIGPMIRAGERFVAAGTDAGVRALWFSPDGRRWDRQPNAEAEFQKGRIDAFARFGPLTLAVGTVDHPTQSADNVAAVWSSPDGGVTWERIAAGNPAFFVRPTTQMFGVAGGTNGAVAVGLSYDIGATIDAHAWFSTDGRTWRQVVEPAEWSGPGDQSLGGVCALPQGGFVAIGGITRRGVHEGWTWVSADGIAWERSPAGGAQGPNFRPSACLTTPDGVLLAGAVWGPHGFDGSLLRSVDGRVWTEIGAPGALAVEGEDVLVGVAAEGARIVVAARQHDDLAVYTSADGGRTWLKREAAVLGGLGPQVASEVVMVDDEVLITGSDNAGGAVWVGPAP